MKKFNILKSIVDFTWINVCLGFFVYSIFVVILLCRHIFLSRDAVHNGWLTSLLCFKFNERRFLTHRVGEDEKFLGSLCRLCL